MGCGDRWVTMGYASKQWREFEHYRDHRSLLLVSRSKTESMFTLSNKVYAEDPHHHYLLAIPSHKDINTRLLRSGVRLPRRWPSCLKRTVSMDGLGVCGPKWSHRHVYGKCCAGRASKPKTQKIRYFEDSDVGLLTKTISGTTYGIVKTVV